MAGDASGLYNSSAIWTPLMENILKGLLINSPDERFGQMLQREREKKLKLSAKTHASLSRKFGILDISFWIEAC